VLEVVRVQLICKCMQFLSVAAVIKRSAGSAHYRFYLFPRLRRC